MRPDFSSRYPAYTSNRIVLRRGHGCGCASLQLPRRRVAQRGCLDAVCAARVSGGLPAASGGGSYWHVAAQGRFFTETALRRFGARISHRAIPATRRTALSCHDAAVAAAPPCRCYGAVWQRGVVSVRGVRCPCFRGSSSCKRWRQLRPSGAALSGGGASWGAVAQRAACSCLGGPALCGVCASSGWPQPDYR